MTLCSYKHRCSKMTTFVVCVAGALDSLVIKTHPGRVLMLFLTSCTLYLRFSVKPLSRMFLEVVSLKVWPPSGVLALCSPVGHQANTPLRLLLCVISIRQARLSPSWFPCQSCFFLKEMKAPQMYHVCLKYEGSTINTKITYTHTQSREAIFFSQSPITFPYTHIHEILGINSYLLGICFTFLYQLLVLAMIYIFINKLGTW